MKHYIIFSIFFIALSVVSCKTGKATMPAEILTGTTWELSSLYGKDLTPEIYSRGLPYITFGTDNRITGNSGCNTFGGSYNLNDEGGMNVSQVMATKMYCEGIDEISFFEALDKITVSKARKDKLVLMNGADAIMVFVPKK